jgi:hypothetical protein
MPGVPDDNTSIVEHRIPTYSEIMPVNDRFRRETLPPTTASATHRCLIICKSFISAGVVRR